MDLANGKTVPDECVKALDELDKIWPGASFPRARGAIVSAVLESYAKLDKPKRKNRKQSK